MTDPGRLGRLQQTAQQFRMGAYRDVLRALEAEPENGGEIGRAMLLTARAMVLEAEGRIADASSLMEEALGLIVPVPAVLEAMAGFFARHGQPMLAHYAFLMADVCQPRSLALFEARQSGSERARYAPWALRRSEPVRGANLYRLAARKVELRERLGLDGAAMALATMAGRQGAYLATERPLYRLVDHAREHARDFRELGVPRTVTYPSPNVHGLPPGPSVERTTRPFFTCTLEDVVVSARSDILLTSDAALVDAITIKATNLFFDVDPILAGGGPERAFVVEAANPARLRHVPQAMWLSGIDSRQFGHWLVEYLPRVWAFMQHPGFTDLPIIIDEDMPRQMEESLRFFLGPTHPVVHLAPGERVLVGNLWVASRIMHRDTVDVDAWLQLMERARPMLERVELANAPERIYLARKPMQHRRLVNAAAVEAMVVRRGYEVHDFAEVPFVEQIRLIRGARHVLGPEESAFLMTFLGRPGLRISKLSPPVLDEVEGYVQICTAQDQDCTVFVGTLEKENLRFPNMSDYSIDPEQLARYLDGVDRELDAMSDRADELTRVLMREPVGSIRRDGSRPRAGRSRQRRGPGRAAQTWLVDVVHADNVDGTGGGNLGGRGPERMLASWRLEIGNHAPHGSEPCGGCSQEGT